MQWALSTHLWRCCKSVVILRPQVWVQVASLWAQLTCSWIIWLWTGSVKSFQKTIFTNFLFFNHPRFCLYIGHKANQKSVNCWEMISNILNYLKWYLLNLDLGDGGLRRWRGELLALKLSLHGGQTTWQWAGLWLVHHLSATTDNRKWKVDLQKHLNWFQLVFYLMAVSVFWVSWRRAHIYFLSFR